MELATRKPSAFGDEAITGHGPWRDSRVGSSALAVTARAVLGAALMELSYELE